MTLNSSGPLSLGGPTTGQSVALELNQSATAQISLNDTLVRTLLGVSSGTIAINSAYSKPTNNPYSYTSPGDYTLVLAAYQYIDVRSEEHTSELQSH